jgi:hypothetical protein
MATIRPEEPTDTNINPTVNHTPAESSDGIHSGERDDGPEMVMDEECLGIWRQLYICVGDNGSRKL